MFKNMKVRSKIIFSVGIILVVLVSLIVGIVLVQVDSLTGNMSHERITGMAGAAQQKLSDFQETTRLVALAVAHDYYMIENLIRWNSDESEQNRVVARNDIIDVLRNAAVEYGVDSFVVRDFEGRVIVRLHAMENWNDFDNTAAGNAALEGRTTSSFSSTGTMPLGLNTTVPVRQGGEIIGTMTPLFFLHTDAFVDRFGAIYNAEVTIFGGENANTRVASTIIQDGQRVVGTDLTEEQILETVVNQGNVYIGDLSLFGIPHSAVYYPLKSAAGNVVGMLSVAFSNEQVVTDTNTLLIFMIVLGVVGLAAAILVVLFIANMISKPLTILTSFMQNAAKTGDISLRAEDVALIESISAQKDELGQCIGATAKFLSAINKDMDMLERIADGDLTIEPTVLSEKDKIGKALSNVANNLNEMFSDIHNASGQVSTGSKQIADGAQVLAQGSTEQASSMQELSASIADIAKRTKDNAITAGKTAEMSKTIRESAEKGNRQMGEMITAVSDINEASKGISNIIKTIDDIAFQTNILALNAAVEAARAGQHGKGFAVVAEEVRNLASKSAEAAKDTGTMIQNSMEKAELGSRIASETANSLSEIVSGISESNKLITEIAEASEAQSKGISQVNTGIDQVAQVVQQNSATAQESAAASEQMSGQSLVLEELISRFKLKNTNSHSFGLPPAASKLPSASAAFENKSTGQGSSFSSDSFGKY